MSEEIGNACIHFFERMCLSTDRFPQTRKRKYDMVKTDHAEINP